MVISEQPGENWHGIIGDPTIADAIVNRLSFHSYRIEITGVENGADGDSSSLRKKRIDIDVGLFENCSYRTFWEITGMVWNGCPLSRFRVPPDLVAPAGGSIELKPKPTASIGDIAVR